MKKMNIKDYPEYKNYKCMVKRCSATKGKNYRDYSSKGITVDPRWKGSGGFLRFLEDMGRKQQGQTIDRKDNGLGYTPNNCRWSDSITQANNTTRNVYITHNNKIQSITQWSRELGISRYILKYQINKGLTLQEILDKCTLLPSKGVFRIDSNYKMIVQCAKQCGKSEISQKYLREKLTEKSNIHVEVNIPFKEYEVRF